MTRYILDSNVYIRASRDRDARRAFDAFLDTSFHHTDFAATVWMELQAGARSPRDRADVDLLVSPYLDADRMLGPSPVALQQAGRVLAALARTEGLDLSGVRPAFHHDVLLAVTAREHRRTLVTANARDFMRIKRHLSGFRFVAPYP